MYHFEVDVSYSHIQEIEEGDETYRDCFLQAFGMEDYDETHWRNVFNELVNNLLHSPLIIHLLERISTKIGIPIKPEKQRDSYEICMIFLFNYTYFEKFHVVLREFNYQRLDEHSPCYQDLLNFIDETE